LPDEDCAVAGCSPKESGCSWSASAWLFAAAPLFVDLVRFRLQVVGDLEQLPARTLTVRFAGKPPGQLRTGAQRACRFILHDRRLKRATGFSASLLVSGEVADNRAFPRSKAIRAGPKRTFG
jgi:hypothetical protein